MSTWIDGVVSSRLRERRDVATSRATKVVQMLSTRGIKIRVVGSLVEGRFALHSDVDFLVEKCPRQLKYSIESIVESVMLDIPFDVIYQDEVETEGV
jgi:predicted nucleotidyltransferase